MKSLSQDIREQAEEIISNQLDDMEDVIKDYYERNRDFYEIVQLKDEDKKQKTITKRIPTEIVIERDELDINIAIVTNDKVNDRILHAQHTGTGLQISDQILDKFGVPKESRTKLVMSRKYFDPNNADIVFKNDLKILLNAKKS